MVRVVHLVDPAAMPEALLELATLAQADQTIVRLGPATLPAETEAPVRSAHRPFGCTRLAAPRGAPLPPFDVLHAWSGPCAHLALRLAGRAGARVILSGVAAERLAAQHGFAKACHAGCLTIVLATQESADRLAQAGFPAARLAVIPPAAPWVAAPDRQHVRQHLRLGPEAFVVAAPQPLTDMSSVQSTIWAFGIFRFLRPAARLVLPWDGPARADTQRFAVGTGFAKDILVAPAAHHPFEPLGACDAVLFGGPQVAPVCLAAALRAGLPVVAPWSPLCHELTDQGRAAMLVNSGQARDYAAALLELADRPRRAAELADRARRWAQDRFDAISLRRQWHELYARSAAR
jgi:glycosyltransferase involved in cell wall biosynthesis